MRSLAILFLFLSLSSHLSATRVTTAPIEQLQIYEKLSSYLKSPDANVDTFIAETTGFIRNKDLVVFLDGQKQWHSLYRKVTEQLDELSESDKFAYQQGEYRRFRERKTHDWVEPLRGKLFFKSAAGVNFYSEIALQHLNLGHGDLSCYLFHELARSPSISAYQRIGFLIMTALAAKTFAYESLIESLLLEIQLLSNGQTSLESWADDFKKHVGWDWRSTLFNKNVPGQVTFEKVKAQIQKTPSSQTTVSESFLEALIYESLDPNLSVRKKAITLLQGVSSETLSKIALKTVLPNHFASALENIENIGLPSQVRSFGSAERLGGFSGNQLYSLDNDVLYARNLDTGLKSVVGKLPATEFDPVLTIPKLNNKIFAVFSKSKINGNLYQIDGKKISPHPVMEKCPSDSFRDAQFSNDGDTVAIKCVQGSDHDKIMVFNLANAKTELIFTSPRANSFTYLTVSPKGRYVAYYSHENKGGLTTKLNVWGATKNLVQIEKEYPFNKITKLVDRVTQVKQPVFADDESDLAVQWKGNIETWDLNDGTVLTKDAVNSPRRDCVIFHPSKSELKWIEFTSDAATFRQRDSSQLQLSLGKFSNVPLALQGEKLFYLNSRNQLIEAYTSNGWHPEEVAALLKTRRLEDRAGEMARESPKE